MPTVSRRPFGQPILDCFKRLSGRARHSSLTESDPLRKPNRLFLAPRTHQKLTPTPRLFLNHSDIRFPHCAVGGAATEKAHRPADLRPKRDSRPIGDVDRPLTIGQRQLLVGHAEDQHDLGSVCQTVTQSVIIVGIDGLSRVTVSTPLVGTVLSLLENPDHCGNRRP